MESKHGWYFLRHSSRNHTTFARLHLIWLQMFLKDSLCQQWFVGYGLLVFVLTFTSPVTVFSLTMYFSMVMFIVTKHWIVNKLEFAALIKLARKRRLGEMIIEDLVPFLTTVTEKKTEVQHGVNQMACGHLFSDIVGYTALASKLTADQTFILLSQVYEVFDRLCIKWGITKIETIGDCYWCAVGTESGATQEDMVRLLGFALEMSKEASLVELPLNVSSGGGLSLRIGVHYGPCFGGVVGFKMPRYHLFGSHVSVAQVLEQSGSSTGVHMSSAAARLAGVSEQGIVTVNMDNLLKAGQARTYQDAGNVVENGEKALQDSMQKEGMHLLSSVCELPENRVNEIEQILASSNPLGLGDMQNDAQNHIAQAYEVFPTYLVTPIPRMSA